MFSLVGGRSGTVRRGRVRYVDAAPRTLVLVPFMLLLAAAPALAQSSLSEITVDVVSSMPSWNRTEGLVPLYGAASTVTIDDSSYTSGYEFIMVLRDNVTYANLEQVCHIISPDQNATVESACWQSLSRQTHDGASPDDVVSWRIGSIGPSTESDFEVLRTELVPYVSFFERNRYVTVKARKFMASAGADKPGSAAQDVEIDELVGDEIGRDALVDASLGDDMEEGIEEASFEVAGELVDFDADAPSAEAPLQSPLSELASGSTPDDTSSVGPSGSPLVEATIDSVDFSLPWNLDRIDQPSLPLNAEFYPGGNGGEGVHVYVLDTGVRGTHVDFAGRIGEGFSSYDTEPTTDPQGHGTHVAGTAAGTYHGVAKKAFVHPVQVVGSTGSGPLTNFIAGLGWVRNHVASNGNWSAVAIASLSTPNSPALDYAVKALYESGVTFVCSAGNTYGGDACSESPANSQYSITVGASDKNDEVGSYASVGSCVDIVAPGTAVLSAGPGSDDQVVTLTGTSQAAPQVAGAAALVKGMDPSLTPDQIKSRILSSAVILPTLGSTVTNKFLQVEQSTFF